MAFRRDGRTVIVEYDGDEHYCNTLKIKIDREKDEKARSLDFAVVRFPFWVQLDTLTAKHYFGLEAEVIQDFPHGFITTKWFPASFCELGLQRFRSELESLPETVRTSVLDSLETKASKHGADYVLPAFLRSK